MKSNNVFHHTDTLSILGLLCIFAGSLILVILSGARIYKRIADRDTMAYEMRTTCTYLATKIRSADSLDNVEIVDAEGRKMLKISDKFDEGQFCTYIYYHDGYLKEAYLLNSAQFTPETGEKLVRINSVDFDMTDGLVKVTVDMKNSGPVAVNVYVNGKGIAA